jgi:hypothetical protein
MTQDDLSHMSLEELIDLALELNAEIEALKLKLEKARSRPRSPVILLSHLLGTRSLIC